MCVKGPESEVPGTLIALNWGAELNLRAQGHKDLFIRTKYYKRTTCPKVGGRLIVLFKYLWVKLVALGAQTLALSLTGWVIAGKVTSL